MAGDVYGLVNEPSIGGVRYCILFIDVHTRYASVYFMKSKSESLDCMKQFVADEGCPEKIAIESEVEVIRSDNGGEYSSRAFTDYCKHKGIKHEFTVPYTPEWNGIAERYWQTTNVNMFTQGKWGS